MSAVLELHFAPGAAGRFIEQLWQHLPVHPDGVFVGAMHVIGDRHQIVLNLRCPQPQQVVVLPGQVLLVVDPSDPASWSVVDRPDTMHLRLPK